MLAGKVNNFTPYHFAWLIQKSTFNKKSGAGFTLLEVLLALAILTIAVLTLMGLFPLGLKGSSQAKQITVAINLAQAKLEQIISQPYDEVASGAFEETSLSSLSSDFSAFGRLTRISLIDDNLNPSQQDLGLKKVEVFVNWPDAFKGGRSTTTLTTIITRL